MLCGGTQHTKYYHSTLTRVGRRQRSGQRLRLRTFRTRVRIPATGVQFFFHAPNAEEKSAVSQQRHLHPYVETISVSQCASTYIQPLSGNCSGRGPATTTYNAPQLLHIYFEIFIYKCFLVTSRENTYNVFQKSALVQNDRNWL